MRLLLAFYFLLVIGSVSAECRNKSCMSNEFKFVEEKIPGTYFLLR